VGQVLKKLGVKRKPELDTIIKCIQKLMAPPSPREDVALEALNYLAKHFGNYQTEYSAHGLSQSFIPTDKGLRSPSSCYITSNPLGLPKAHNSLATYAEVLGIKLQPTISSVLEQVQISITKEYSRVILGYLYDR
jgi:hypothetical protein